MKIRNIFDEETTDIRDILVTVLDHFYAAFNSNPPEEMKIRNLSNWHMALGDLTDETIESGFRKSVKENIKIFPFPGEFRSYCVSQPESK